MAYPFDREDHDTELAELVPDLVPTDDVIDLPVYEDDEYDYEPDYNYPGEDF